MTAAISGLAWGPQALTGLLVFFTMLRCNQLLSPRGFLASLQLLLTARFCFPLEAWCLHVCVVGRCDPESLGSLLNISQANSTPAGEEQQGTSNSGDIDYQQPQTLGEVRVADSRIK